MNHIGCIHISFLHEMTADVWLGFFSVMPDNYMCYRYVLNPDVVNCDALEHSFISSFIFTLVTSKLHIDVSYIAAQLVPGR